LGWLLLEEPEMEELEIEASEIQEPEIKAWLILSFKSYAFCWFKIGLCGVILF